MPVALHSLSLQERRGTQVSAQMLRPIQRLLLSSHMRPSLWLQHTGVLVCSALWTRDLSGLWENTVFPPSFPGSHCGSARPPTRSPHHRRCCCVLIPDGCSQPSCSLCSAAERPATQKHQTGEPAHLIPVVQSGLAMLSGSEGIWADTALQKSQEL